MTHDKDQMVDIFFDHVVEIAQQLRKHLGQKKPSISGVVTIALHAASTVWLCSRHPQPWSVAREAQDCAMLSAGYQLGNNWSVAYNLEQQSIKHAVQSLLLELEVRGSTLIFDEQTQQTLRQINSWR